MKVLVDLHHGVLYEGFALLFEDRYGADLRAWQDGHYVTGPYHHADFPPRQVRVMDDDAVRSWRPDFVIATAGVNRYRMRALASEVGAVYVDHCGNPWDEPIGSTVLRSMTLPGTTGIVWHPEFHRVPWTPPEGDRVGAFHTSFATLEPCRSIWDQKATPAWVMYGAVVPLMPYQVAAARAACVAAWVCKDTDGYGFAVHEAFASGRPVIGHASHYAGKLAEPLFVRGVTYLEPEDDLGPVLADPVPMGLAAKARFEELVDFDAEAEAVGRYLASLAGVAA